MKRSGIFFGLFIILLGAALLAVNLGYASQRIWGFFWPGLLVLLGAWFLLRPRISQQPVTVDKASFPLNGAAEGEISFHYGAGVLHISDSSMPNELAGGSFTGGVLADQSSRGGIAVLSLKSPSDRIFEGPWGVGEKGFDWTVGINAQIPLSLDLHTGANEQIMDLSRTQVKSLNLETGASHSVITLPASAGFSQVTVKSGLADVNITVPEGVGALIHVSSGLSGIKVNTDRFPKVGELYQSADYLSAANKAEIHIESGLGAVTIQ